MRRRSGSRRYSMHIRHIGHIPPVKRLIEGFRASKHSSSEQHTRHGISSGFQLFKCDPTQKSSWAWAKGKRATSLFAHVFCRGSAVAFDRHARCSKTCFLSNAIIFLISLHLYLELRIGGRSHCRYLDEAVFKTMGSSILAGSISECSVGSFFADHHGWGKRPDKSDNAKKKRNRKGDMLSPRVLLRPPDRPVIVVSVQVTLRDHEFRRVKDSEGATTANIGVYMSNREYY